MELIKFVYVFVNGAILIGVAALCGWCTLHARRDNSTLGVIVGALLAITFIIMTILFFNGVFGDGNF